MTKRFIKAVTLGILLVPMIALVFAAMLYIVTLDFVFIKGWADGLVKLVTTNPFSEEAFNIRAYLLSILVVGVMSYYSMEDK